MRTWTYEYFSKYLRYDPNSAGVYWHTKSGKQGNFKAGSRAGKELPNGYRVIRIHHRGYAEARIAYILFHKVDISKDLLIDHINGTPNDNRIENLRAVSSNANQQNQRVHRMGQPVGLTFHKQSNKWQAMRPKVYAGSVFNKPKYIGLFKTQEEAVKALIASVQPSPPQSDRRDG